MRRRPRLVAWLLPALFALGPAPDDLSTPKPKPLPFAAHNCYPDDGRGDARLREAIALGLDNIEIDLGWDEKGSRLIVSHTAEPVEGMPYPTFEDYVRPLLDAPPRPDAAPSVLNIDWKTKRPEAVARFKAFLDAHPDTFSSAPKAEKSPMTPRRLTVDFSGDLDAQAAYDALIPAGGTYRAFADHVYRGATYRPDPTTYPDGPADAYHRFVTYDWAVVEAGGPSLARDWSKGEAARLKVLIDRAHAQGYRVRVYCLNARGPVLAINYRFPTAESALLRWHAAVDAGADWVSTDDYSRAASEFRGG